MCEETGLFMELLSEASHPRVAGIVQTHRQHIGAQHGQQGVMTKDIGFSDSIKGPCWCQATSQNMGPTGFYKVIIYLAHRCRHA